MKLGIWERGGCLGRSFETKPDYMRDYMRCARLLTPLLLLHPSKTLFQQSQTSVMLISFFLVFFFKKKRMTLEMLFAKDFDNKSCSIKDLQAAWWSFPLFYMVRSSYLVDWLSRKSTQHIHKVSCPELTNICIYLFYFFLPDHMAVCILKVAAWEMRCQVGDDLLHIHRWVHWGSAAAAAY